MKKSKTFYSISKETSRRIGRLTDEQLEQMLKLLDIGILLPVDRVGANLIVAAHEPEKEIVDALDKVENNATHKIKEEKSFK